MKSGRLQKVSAASLAVLLVLILAACGHVQLIAPYDERIESGITELQKNTTTFFVKIERQGGSNKEDYKNNTKFYDDARVLAKSLLIRAGATAQNQKTEGQIQSLIKKYADMETQHRTNGLTPYTIAPLEDSFYMTFRAILTLEVAKKDISSK